MDFSIEITKEKGKCVFSNKTYNTNDFIGEYISSTKNNIGRMLIKDKWETEILGRYCSHNSTPNTTLIVENNSINLYANCKININDEIVVNYKEVESLLNLPSNIFYSPLFVEIILKVNKTII